MKKLITSCSLAVALAVPAAANAGQPTPPVYKNAAKQCKALKAAAGTNNFNELYGTKKNAYGKCVSSLSKQKQKTEERQQEEAKSNAAKDCKAERADQNFAASHGGKTFAEFYGTNKNGKNAYGKCVSSKAKANKAEADEQEAQKDENRVNAAKQCKAERGDENFASTHDNKSFAEFYGTNTNNKNAFGKCVSKKASEQNEQQS
jgi:hypothetical protein